MNQKEWLKNFYSIHQYNTDELRVLEQAKQIKEDPRFYGKWQEALNIAIDIKFDSVQIDQNAMKRI